MKIESSFGWAGPDPVDVRVTNRTGATLTVGEIVMLDIARADADSTSNNAGLQSAGVANVIDPTTANLEHGIFGVALQAAADDRVLMVRLRGAVETAKTAAAVALADQLVAANGVNTLAVAGVSSAKIIALPLTTVGAAGSISCYFDGITGFGKAT